MSPTWPDPVRLRSAIVIVETEAGETMQAVLTPEEWQPVTVTMDVEYDFDDYRLFPPEGSTRPYWTITLVAGGFHGQLRPQQHTAEQAGPVEIERLAKRMDLIAYVEGSER